MKRSNKVLYEYDENIASFFNQCQLRVGSLSFTKQTIMSEHKTLVRAPIAVRCSAGGVFIKRFPQTTRETSSSITQSPTRAHRRVTHRDRKKIKLSSRIAKACQRHMCLEAEESEFCLFDLSLLAATSSLSHLHRLSNLLDAH